MKSAEEIVRGWEALAPGFGCRDLPARMDPLRRCDLYTQLALDRLTQKERVVAAIFERSGQDWNQTLYTMLLRTVGDLQNRKAFMTLAERLPYAVILRERASILAVEALLFGAAGMLADLEEDSYVKRLREEFDHLACKYQIEPMTGDSWRINSLRPANHPRLRLAQVAAFLQQSRFLITPILECHTCKQVEQLFRVEASHYWSNYYNPGPGVDHTTKRLGAFKAQSLGINLVAVMQFFYGHHTGNEALAHCALELWEALPAEQNRYTRLWEALSPLNALESQALLQLAREYCEQTRCRQCPLAKLRLYDLRKQGLVER